MGKPGTTDNRQMKSNNGILAALGGTVISLACCGVGQAALAVYEPFGQVPGSSLGGAAGGIGLGNYTQEAGSGNPIIAGSLSYGTLSTSGNQFAPAGVSVGYSNDISSLGASGLLADGTTLWMSVLLQPLKGSNSRAGITIGTDYYNSGSVAIETTNGGNGVGIHLQNGSDLEILTALGGTESRNRAQDNLSLIEPTFVVLEMIWGATGAANDTVNIYLPGTDLVLPGSVQDTSTLVVDQSQFNVFSLSATKDSYLIDEIRYGASYADVISPVPEPSTPALFSFIAVIALWRRRR